MTGRWITLAVVAATLVLCAGCGAGRGGGVESSGERLARGWDRYRLGEFSLALKEFEAAAQGVAPGSSNHLAALYAQATTWNLRRPDADKARAERLYREVIALAPTNDLAAWSWLALARMKADDAVLDLYCGIGGSLRRWSARGALLYRTVPLPASRDRT